MLDEIKQKVFNANIELYNSKLVIFTWGNVSEKCGDYIVIKPSGVKYEEMTPEDMVVVDMNGNIIDGKLNPSSDTPTHIELYKSFPNINGVCHTHSNYATSYAQSGKPIEALGTTHADYFYGDVPCTRELTKEETETNYERNTGLVIAERFKNLDYMAIPAVLVKHHGVFTWGKSAGESVHNAIVLEEIAKMNFKTNLINNANNRLQQYTLDKHYSRKHGKDAYYGQKG